MEGEKNRYRVYKTLTGVPDLKKVHLYVCTCRLIYAGTFVRLLSYRYPQRWFLPEDAKIKVGKKKKILSEASK